MRKDNRKRWERIRYFLQYFNGDELLEVREYADKLYQRFYSQRSFRRHKARK